MSVVGFDLGNQSCVVTVVKEQERRIEVVFNDESKCETPALVCFVDKQRFFGTDAAATSMMNSTNTISLIKRLIGRCFSDPELQQDLKTFSFSVTEGPDGFPLIHAQYLGEEKSYTPTQVMGMVFSHMKTMAEKKLNAAVSNCCIGIPVYFNNLQRRAVLNAAAIAGLHPLRLIPETTAAALAYGILKNDLPEKEQLNVAFVDIGHASMQVCIAGFKRSQMKILAHSFDRCLGGRDIDEILFQHFAENFKTEYKIDVLEDTRACFRLRAACENLKKGLGENPEASFGIRCLMDLEDVTGFINRDEFEQIITPILERIKKPLVKALFEAQLTVDSIHVVEVVGLGSRVPAIINILTEFFKKEPSRTMGARECVSKGCALDCAMRTPRLRVREFQVQESFPFPITITWKGSGIDSQYKSTIVFTKGEPIPSVKGLAFCVYMSSTCTLELQYAHISELQAPPKIATYVIGPLQSAKDERSLVKVKISWNVHGVVTLESLQFVEQKGINANIEASNVAIKVRLPVSEVVPGGMLDEDLQKAVDNEFDMAFQDLVIKETNDKRNTVEAYVYDMRKKLHDKLLELDNDTERKEFIAKLQETEDWLYEDGEDETKGAYIAKLDELKKQGDPIERRYKKHLERGTFVSWRPGFVNWYKQAASNNLEYERLDMNEKQKMYEYEMALQERVMKETKDKKNAVEAYVYDMRNKLHDKLHKFVTDSEKEGLIAKLKDTEDWLYEDGKDETKGVYIAKLDELTKQGDPIEQRYKEYSQREYFVNHLKNLVSRYKHAAMHDLEYQHMDSTVKQNVWSECWKAEIWLKEKKQLQDTLPQNADPVLLSSEIQNKTEALERVCGPYFD